jgi:hypothetical protein
MREGSYICLETRLTQHNMTPVRMAMHIYPLSLSRLLSATLPLLIPDLFLLPVAYSQFIRHKAYLHLAIRNNAAQTETVRVRKRVNTRKNAANGRGLENCCSPHPQIHKISSKEMHSLTICLLLPDSHFAHRRTSHTSSPHTQFNTVNAFNRQNTLR